MALENTATLYLKKKNQINKIPAVYVLPFTKHSTELHSQVKANHTAVNTSKNVISHIGFLSGTKHYTFSFFNTLRSHYRSTYTSTGLNMKLPIVKKQQRNYIFFLLLLQCSFTFQCFFPTWFQVPAITCRWIAHLLP